jgi:hypothetical protein
MAQEQPLSPRSPVPVRRRKVRSLSVHVRHHPRHLGHVRLGGGLLPPPCDAPVPLKPLSQRAVDYGRHGQGLSRLHQVLGVRGEVRLDPHGHARLPVPHTPGSYEWRRLVRRRARGPARCPAGAPARWREPRASSLSGTRSNRLSYNPRRTGWRSSQARRTSRGQEQVPPDVAQRTAVQEPGQVFRPGRRTQHLLVHRPQHVRSERSNLRSAADQNSRKGSSTVPRWALAVPQDPQPPAPSRGAAISEVLLDPVARGRVVDRLYLAALQVGSDSIQALPAAIHVQQSLGLVEDPVAFGGSGHGLRLSPGRPPDRSSSSRASGYSLAVRIASASASRRRSSSAVTLDDRSGSALSWRMSSRTISAAATSRACA